MPLFDRLKAKALLHEVKIAHIVTGKDFGRVRLVYPKLKGSEQVRRDIEQELSGYSEITHYDLNHVTGSVTLTFNPGSLKHGSFLAVLFDEACRHYFGGKAQDAR